MRQFIFFLLMSVLVQATAQGQNEGIPLGKAKAFRLRLGLGVSLSSTTKQLKSHLEKNGFGSNYHNSGFIFDGEVKYPQTTNMPLVVEVTLERQLNRAQQRFVPQRMR